MNPVLTQTTEFLSRIERDLSELVKFLDKSKKIGCVDNEESIRQHLADNAQAIVESSVLMAQLLLLKIQLSVGYETSGRFDFRATKKSAGDDLEATISGLRSIVYALQERSKSLRYLYQRHLGQPTEVESREI